MQSPAASNAPYSSLLQAVGKSSFHTSPTTNGSHSKKAETDTEILSAYNAPILASTAAALEVWTDGSVKHKEESAGAFVLVEDGTVVKEGSMSLGASACSYSVERGRDAARPHYPGAMVHRSAAHV